MIPASTRRNRHFPPRQKLRFPAELQPLSPRMDAGAARRGRWECFLPSASRLTLARLLQGAGAATGPRAAGNGRRGARSRPSVPGDASERHYFGANVSLCSSSRHIHSLTHTYIDTYTHTHTRVGFPRSCCSSGNNMGTSGPDLSE